MITSLRRLCAVLLTGIALLGLPSLAQAGPGCYGKMWNPLTDINFNLIGGIKIAGISFMKDPKELGSPSGASAKAICSCGLYIGVGISFWQPEYIMDISRRGSGCLGMLNGMEILPGFSSLASDQSAPMHEKAKEGATRMQVHWAYADITAIAGKQLFERCNAVKGGFDLAYLTEPDFVWQNDVYGAIMNPLNAILAGAPVLSQMVCGAESICNTLDGWCDSGLCAWKGTRYPLTGNSISKDSAQHTNMDIAIKFLARHSLTGLLLKTTGDEALCKAKYSPIYNAFQHRYQWAYPNKTQTRFNVDMMRWGMAIKGGSTNSLTSLTGQSAQLVSSDANNASISGSIVSVANDIWSRVPKGLNYPTREAGFMQIWEFRQCCMEVITIETILKMAASIVGGDVAVLMQYYEYASTALKIIKDPIGGLMGLAGDGMGYLLEGAGSGIVNSVKDLVK